MSAQCTGRPPAALIACRAFPALRGNMRRTPARAAAALLLFFVVLLGSSCVQRSAAVPFSSLSPPPAIKLVSTPGFGGTVCVLSASGRNISSIVAADLAPYSSGVCSGGVAVNAVDLR